MGATKVGDFFLRSQRVLRISSVLGRSGDINSAEAYNRVLAAINDPLVEAVIFDRAFAITSRGVSSTNFIFPVRDGLTYEGNPGKLIDCTGWGRSGSRRRLFQGGGAPAAPMVLANNVAAGQTSIQLSTPQAATVVRGQKLLLTSDRVFFEGGTFVLTLAGAPAIVPGETLTQAVSGATGPASAVSTVGGITTVTMDTSTGQFVTGQQLTGSTSGALGAASLVTLVRTPEAQSETLTITHKDGDTVHFWPATRDSYLTANGARLHRIDFAKRPQFFGVAAEGPGQFTALEIGDRMFNTLWTLDLQIDGCVSNFFDNGNYLYGAEGGRANFSWQFEPNNGRNMNQYGCGVVGPTEGFLVEDCTGVGGKHAVIQTEGLEAPGVTRNLVVRGTRATGTWNFSHATHTNAIGLTVENTLIKDCNGGIEAGCPNVTTRNNDIRRLPQSGTPQGAALLGIGIVVADFGMEMSSADDKVTGGLFAFRLNTSAFPFFPASNGPREITLENFRAEGFLQRGVQVLWNGGAVRQNVHLRGVRTRRAGFNPAGGVTVPPSIEINGLLERVSITECDLQAEPGNTASCITMSGGFDKVHVSDVLYSGHSAPAPASNPGVTYTNVRAY
jgi:hypothetical protein